MTSILALALCAGMPMLAQAPGLSVTSASGDSTVQLYGLLDLGVGRVAHGYSFNPTYGNSTDPRPAKVATKPVTGMMNGGLSGDRIGVRGSTKLLEDWKAIFNLEAAINLNSGSLTNAAQGLAQNIAGTAAQPAGEYSSDSASSGQLFSRAANFGVASDTYGTLTAGRNTSFMLDIIPGYDPLNGAQMFSPIGYSGTYGGGGLTDNSRIDNSLKYRHKIGAFNFGLLHKFGGVSGSSTARGADQALAGYEAGPFGIQLSYESAKDVSSLSNNATYAAGVYTGLNTVKATFYDTKATMLTLRYQLGELSLRGGWQRQEFTNPSNPTLDAQVTNLFGQTIGAWSTAPLTIGGSDQAKTITISWIGANYNVTKAFNVAAGCYSVKQNDFSNGQAIAADKAGSGTFGSLLLDYRFTKAFDVYAAYMGSQYKDGMAAGYALASNNILGLGARYAF